MASVVVDTHTAIWYLESSPHLSAAALTAIRSAIAAGDPVFVSAVTVVELTYLVEKGRLRSTLLDRLVALLQQSNSGFQPAPLDLLTAATLRSVPASIRDMPDRMIAATAVALGLALVTRDQQIQNSGIPTIW
ncbi:MAG: type II toxin-antitoxin system VapC family toxin [Gemmataceae bacterium]|nr:type II toxin-antitoxin system VapC family toxin [Gemmataceae bacterium]